MSQSWAAPLGAIVIALSCGCTIDSIGTARSAVVCRETVSPDSRGQPRNTAGQIRYCWPEDALCFCDQDNDCYALNGYVPCTPPTDAGADAAIDVPRDVAMDLGVDARVDAGVCPPETTTPDSQGRPRNAAGVIRYCWPGEAHCFCDSDNDCYAEAGYVACSRSTDAGVDAALDAPRDAPLDVAMDLGVDARVDAGACPPEATTPDGQGRPRNAAGVIRYCWPGEAHCFCDSDNDCYAEAGYVACSRSTDAGVDAALDAPRDAPLDVAMDLGVDARVDAGDPRGVTGEWTTPVLWPVFSVHASVLPNGRVLVWPTGGHSADARVWDPATNTFAGVPMTRTDIGCAGHAFLPDGRLFVTGGEVALADHVGPRDTNFFDYSSNAWTAGPDMNVGRWYPTNTALPDGSMLVTAGDTEPGVAASIPEIWSAAGLRRLTGASLDLPTYPFMHVAPSGRVFYSGPSNPSRYLDTSSAGAWSVVATMNIANRDEGSSVQYDDGRVLVAGGHDPPTATAEVINLNDAAPRWRSVPPMAFVRRQIDLTLLPDATVVVTGGTQSSGFNEPAGAVLPVEIWNPATETWRTVASMHAARLYHSTALLLPDGRVLSAAGREDLPSGNLNDTTVELFSPPYLFRGPRPTITTAPRTVNYGQTFLVTTPDAASITRATWIRLSAVTHGFNENQRINRLGLAPAAGGVNVTAPASRALCPPGHYMLFLLNGLDVPSVGAIVQIQ